MIYPEGNYIRASDDRPFLQIGESKYGKFTLGLAVLDEVNLTTATKIALTSMVSTAGANLSVGPPYDLVIYRNGTFESFEARINADSPSSAGSRRSGPSTCTGPSPIYPLSRRETWRRDRRPRSGDGPLWDTGVRPHR